MVQLGFSVQAVYCHHLETLELVDAQAPFQSNWIRISGVGPRLGVFQVRC